MGASEHIFIEKGGFRSLGDFDLAKQIAEELVRHYPGHAWAVNVDQEGGIATIQNFNLSTKMGFLLHLRGKHGDHAVPVLLRAAKMGAGEFLERYDLPRGVYREGDYAGVLARNGPALP